MRARDPMERLLEKVSKKQGDGCWEWLGQKHLTGYALIPMKDQDRWRSKRAHRVSWELHFGQIPPGMYVCHRCDNRQCVNPDHLFLGSASDNMQDCARKGRLTTIGQSRKTHCIQGHELTTENTIINKRGHRKCRTCEAASRAQLYARTLGKERKARYGAVLFETEQFCRCATCGKEWTLTGKSQGFIKSGALRHAKACAIVIRSGEGEKKGEVEK